MASRFWVGSAGVWDNSNTANWSATSGGSSGASCPVSSDTVTIDQTNSVVTFGANISVTSITQTAGSLSFSSFNLTTSATCTFGGSNAVVTNLGSGTHIFTTLSVGGASTVSINFGTGNITATLIRQTTDTTGIITSTAGTAAITCGSYGTSNLWTVPPQIINLPSCTNAGVLNIYQPFTFLNLTSTVGNSVIRLGSNITVFGTLTTSGVCEIRSDTTVYQSSQTVIPPENSTNLLAVSITANAVSFGGRTSFYGIAALGASSPWATGDLQVVSDCTNITTTHTPVTRYWVGTGAVSWQSTANWAASSGGSSGSTAPYYGDTAIFDSNGSFTTLTISNLPSLPSLDFTNISGTGTFSMGSTGWMAGNLKMKASQTITATSAFIVAPESTTINITSNSVSLGASWNKVGSGTLKLLDSLSITTLAINNGTFDSNSQNITCSNLQSLGSPTANNYTYSYSTSKTTLNLGSSAITLSSTTSNFRIQGSSSFTTSCLATFTGGTGTKNIGRSDTTAAYPNIRINGFGTGTVVLSGSWNCGTFTVDNPPEAINITSGNTISFNKIVLNATAGNLITLRSVTGGSAAKVKLQQQLNSLNDYCTVQDINVMGSGRLIFGSNSTNTSGNTGNILFSSTSPVPASVADFNLGVLI